MVCRACGKELADDFSYCPHCGNRRATKIVCPSCGKESSVDFSFCPHCGKVFVPGPSVIEPPSLPLEVEAAELERTDQQESAEGDENDRSSKIGTYVFGAFAVIALLVSIVRGIVPYYLLESAVWAGAAWYWHKKKTHSELAKAIVIVLGGLLALGEIVEIVSHWNATSAVSRRSDPFEKYAVPSGTPDSSNSPYSAYTPTASPTQTIPSGEASSSVGGAETAPLEVVPQKQERAPDLKMDAPREHPKDNLREAHRLDHLKRYYEAVPLYEKACDDGEMDGCANLGVLYTQGLGVAQDYNYGHRLTQMACDAGNMDGCTELGRLYQSGKGVPLDNVQARRVYEKVCDNGKMTGCFDLGTLYMAGDGGVQDYAKAFVLFQEACDGGEMAGCTGLGHLYQDGNGVVRDVVRARGLFEKACNSGEVFGCTNLGRMYESGDWVTRDVPRAISFYKKACSGGENSACASLLKLH
jgi:uncharacterized protein